MRENWECTGRMLRCSMSGLVISNWALSRVSPLSACMQFSCINPFFALILVEKSDEGASLRVFGLLSVVANGDMCCVFSMTKSVVGITVDSTHGIGQGKTWTHL